jgi:hypothetical protein
MSTAHETFWLEVRRGRRLFFVWWIAWLPFGLITLITLSSLMGAIGNLGGWVILLSWFIPWIFIVRRLTKLSCPRCHKPAIAHPLFFMRHAVCQHCGLRPNETMEPTR